ncbi:Gar1-domain-containing protein [Dacryopinax primogenitus]|uniref:H/ACA ribonucleoprotein complex subunit n=1 Tax=Dacryopinax primogenitus (strain DJM 731) TaxID=1858805 RepID=M5G9T5_DACPD|nr:Gar1-domain-containing protein [Dacryopinax primogenitus]EJU05574.1 Gar1-domain-containing protein [Dacryopinax primogenitus]
MSRGFNNRGRGFSRGGGRGGGGGWSGGRGGFQQRDMGPPDHVLEIGTFVHDVEDEMLCTVSMPEKVPYFNAPIYLQNKSVIGKVDEILGPINEVYFSVKMGEGMVASSFKKGDKVYIGPDKLLPLDRFLPKPKVAGEVKKRGRGGVGGRGVRGGGRGGFGGRGAPRGRGAPGGFSRGGSRGAFGAPRGAPRGGAGRGFAPRGRGAGGESRGFRGS